MAEILLFHHALGPTEGLHAFAEQLRQAGHTVHTPDLFDGATFESLDDGFAALRAKGEGAQDAWADEVVDALPAGLVYVGVSLGVLPAQRLAQTRPGASGAILLEACVPPSEFGGPWPAGVPVQVHGMQDDPFFGHEGDLDAARELVGSVDDGELFVYPGDVHLFTDSSLPGHDPEATRLVVDRTLGLLARV